jgi:glutamyl-tRNA synthetase
MISASGASRVGRLAPSPTGLLHLGHARTFLIAYWYTRSRGGKLLLRVEDLDAGRSNPEFRAAALEDLEWLGLDWDGPATVQSEHLERFESAARTLLERGAAYPCICSRGDLRTAQSAPQLGDAEPRYPGTCRGRFASIEDAERASGKPAGLRLLVPPGAVTIEDELLGEFTSDVAAEVGDFLVMRRGGSPSYQLAVTVDDAASGVTEVVRGSDLLASAVRQWHVQNALGLPHPTWVHVPLVTDHTGRRLAKRADDLSLAELRRRGVEPTSVVRWAAESAGIALSERMTAAEVTPRFVLERVPRANVALDESTLAHLAAQRMP